MVSSPYPLEGTAPLPTDPELVQNPEPPRSGRWLYLFALTFCFVGLQLGLGIPIVFYMMASQGIQTQTQIEAFILSETGILVNVLIAGFSAMMTILIAFAWPFLWSKLGGAYYSIQEWLEWRKPRYIPVIAAFIVSPIILYGLSIPIVQIFGNSEVDAQLEWFSTPTLQITAAIMAVIFAPIAEEALFRGALYNALLRRADQSTSPTWVRHILPVIVVTISFAAVHLLAGFERIGSIMLILVLSLYLTLLRTVTGSVRTTAAAHMAWNGLAVAAIIAEKMGLV